MPHTSRRPTRRRAVFAISVALVLSVLPVPHVDAIDTDLETSLDTRLVAIARDPDLRPGGVAAPGGRIDVEVFPSPDAPPGIIRALEQLGGGDIVEVGEMISVSVPPGALAALARIPGLDWARVAATPYPEEITGEEVAAIGADDWHTAGITGGGVEIAVIDNGFSGLATVVASGDVPTRHVAQNYCSGGLDGSGSHGTAVAEIAHETAPDALLHLVCIDTLGDLSLAIDWAVAEGIDVVVHSLAWFPPGRGDGSGPLDAIVTAARDGGILWVNSAGNYAEEHWLGTFTDTTIDGIHEFSGTDQRLTFDAPASTSVAVYMRWDDWPVSDVDYDLRLYRGTTLLSSSTDPQTGTQPPDEAVFHTTGVLAPETLAIEIVAVSGTGTPTIDLFVLGSSGAIEYPVAAGSVNDPSGSPKVVAVGAAWHGDGIIEDFSSQGPTIDGRTKPDLTAPDGVSSATFGSFFGTSAAAPGAGGAAALLRQAADCPTPATLHASLVAATVDAGAAGTDNVYGAGLLLLGTAPVETDPVRRYSGPDRFSTASAISTADFACGAPLVFVAVGTGFPDALAGAAAAGRLGAPILLVQQDSIPSATSAELIRLDPDSIVILGGAAAVSDSVATQLEAYGTVSRLAGADRYSTSVAVSQFAFPDGSTTVLVATGLSFADALAGGPAAIHLGAPVLLTDPITLPTSISDEITRLDPDSILVLGGPAAVADSVVTALEAIAPTSRLAGADRFETAATISSTVFPDGSARAYVAVGTNFPDALAGAAAAGFYDGPVLLVQQDSVPASVSTELTRLGVTRIVILGGTAAVSSGVEATLDALMS